MWVPVASLCRCSLLMQRQLTAAMIAYDLWEYSFTALTPPAPANASAPHNLGKETMHITATDQHSDAYTALVR